MNKKYKIFLILVIILFIIINIMIVNSISKSSIDLNEILQNNSFNNNWKEKVKLISKDITPMDHFGISVDIDGGYALVGAPGNIGNGEWSGAAYVFEEHAGEWRQIAKLSPSDGEKGDAFGFSVSLCKSSTMYALIGSPNDDDNGYSSGSAYIFKLNYTDWQQVWEQEAKLIPKDGGELNSFGRSVSLYGDRALIGASNSAYIFRRNGTEWIQETKLLADDGKSTDNFGCDVSIDDNFALIGASYCDYTDSDGYYRENIGAAYLFHFNGLSWNPYQKLIHNDPSPNDWFGYSVYLKRYMAIVGVPFDDDEATDYGSALIFMDNETDWVYAATLRPQGCDFVSDFGYKVCIDEKFDGHYLTYYALVGAPRDNTNGEKSGAVYVYRYSGPYIHSPWILEDKIIPLDNTEGDTFGSSVALDGFTALIGAMNDDCSAESAGSAYIFEPTGCFIEIIDISTLENKTIKVLVKNSGYETCTDIIYEIYFDMKIGFMLSGKKEGNITKLYPFSEKNFHSDKLFGFGFGKVIVKIDDINITKNILVFGSYFKIF